MSSLPKTLIVFSFCITAISCNANQPTESEVSNSYSQASPALFQQLKTYDSLLFNIGFNECNLAVFDSLVADDFEFYHDQSGITPIRRSL